MISPGIHKKPGISGTGVLILILLMILLTACGSAGTTTTGSSNGTTGNQSKLSLSELRMGFIPSENATKVLDDSKPFAAAMQKVLGVPVKISVAPNYTGTIEALSSGKIDVAWFGPFSYVLAADKYNAEAFAQQLYKDGTDHYFSYIITTPKTGIKTLQDLKGHSFTFVDPASTSGNLIPRYTLTKAGLNPDKDLKGTYAGGHDASLLAVLSGKADAGAVASDVYASLQSQGKFKEGELTIITKSDPIPSSPIAYRKELSQSDKEIIKQAFINMKDAEALKAVNAEGGFKVASNGTYDGLRDVAKSLGLDLTKLK